MTYKKILLTGADGMLGSYITRELLSRGFAVRALLQPGRNIDTLKNLPIEITAGDLLKLTDIETAMQGCDALIHTVASTNIWPSRSPLTRKLNIDVVHMLAKLAETHQLKKFIHIGSANSFGPGPKDIANIPLEKRYWGTEKAPYIDWKYGLDYQDSKYAAQEFLLEQYHQKGLPVTIIAPSFMFGAYDSKPGSGAMILAIHNKKTPGYSIGGKSYAAAADVAYAVVSALDRGKSGECYIAGGDNLSYKEAFTRIADVIKAPRPKLFLPPPVTLLTGAAGSLFGKLTHKQPLITYPMARIANAGCYYDSTKARTDLEMPHTSFETAVEQAFSWFSSHGYVK